MKRLLAISLAGSSLFLTPISLKAEDYDAFGIDYSGDASIGNRIYGVDTSDGSKTLLTTKVFDPYRGIILELCLVITAATLHGDASLTRMYTVDLSLAAS